MAETKRFKFLAYAMQAVLGGDKANKLANKIMQDLVK